MLTLNYSIDGKKYSKKIDKTNFDKNVPRISILYGMFKDEEGSYTTDKAGLCNIVPGVYEMDMKFIIKWIEDSVIEKDWEMFVDPSRTGSSLIATKYLGLLLLNKRILHCKRSDEILEYYVHICPCENCGIFFDLCDGSKPDKYYDPEIYHRCHVCKGTEICNKCLEYCGFNSCNYPQSRTSCCYEKCKTCEQIFCDECGKSKYEVHFEECGICKESICIDDLVSCKKCDKKYCSDCRKKLATYCDNCESHKCDECSGENNIFDCTLCEKQICDECSHLCIICNMNMCTSCIKYCDREPENIRRNRIKVSGPIVCKKCIVNHPYHLEKCNMCHEYICETHRTVCSECDKYVCESDSCSQYCMDCGDKNIRSCLHRYNSPPNHVELDINLCYTKNEYRCPFCYGERYLGKYSTISNKYIIKRQDVLDDKLKEFILS